MHAFQRGILPGQERLFRSAVFPPANLPTVQSKSTWPSSPASIHTVEPIAQSSMLMYLLRHIIQQTERSENVGDSQPIKDDSGRVTYVPEVVRIADRRHAVALERCGKLFHDIFVDVAVVKVPCAVRVEEWASATEEGELAVQAGLARTHTCWCPWVATESSLAPQQRCLHWWVPPGRLTQLPLRTSLRCWQRTVLPASCRCSPTRSRCSQPTRSEPSCRPLLRQLRCLRSQL
eukprot:COSAG01_NODE_5778_length_4038_cov_40.442244_5_plen_233_part_00